MRGQLSAEMLILLALILGLVFMVYTQMSKTVDKTAAGVDSKTNQILAAGNCQADADCASLGADYACRSGSCVKSGNS